MYFYYFTYLSLVLLEWVDQLTYIKKRKISTYLTGDTKELSFQNIKHHLLIISWRWTNIDLDCSQRLRLFVLSSTESRSLSYTFMATSSPSAFWIFTDRLVINVLVYILKSISDRTLPWGRPFLWPLHLLFLSLRTT